MTTSVVPRAPAQEPSEARDVIGVLRTKTWLRPSRWREQLELGELVARVASDLWTVYVEGGDVDDDAYPARR